MYLSDNISCDENITLFSVMFHSLLNSEFFFSWTISHINDLHNSQNLNFAVMFIYLGKILERLRLQNKFELRKNTTKF